MELRSYYRKRREVADSLEGEFVLVVSHETPDGGRAGVMTEVRREDAARLIVDGRARVATDEEREQFLAQAAQQRQIAEQRMQAMTPAALTEVELRALRSVLKVSRS